MDPENTSNRVLSPKYYSLVLFTVSATVVAVIIDVSVFKYSTFVEPGYRLSIHVFIIISAICIIGQYFLLKLVRLRNVEGNRRDRALIELGVIHKIVTAIQYVLPSILIIVILQMVFTSTYNTSLIVIAFLVSYFLAVAMMALVSQKFFSWFKSNRDYTILLYGLSAAALCLNVLLSITLIASLSQNLPNEVRPVVGLFRPGSILPVLGNAITISSIVSFSITWVATSLLLRHHSSRFGKGPYWIIMSLPLVYFLSQFLIFFTNPFSFFSSDVVQATVLISIFFSLSKPIGGILFGIAFWDAVRKIHQSSVKWYLIITAYGFMLFFISNEAASVISVPIYPPYGFPTILLTGLSSYLLLIGIYSAAISLSQDNNLRRAVQKLALSQSSLLSSIASAQVEKELLDKVAATIKATQDKVTKETGILSVIKEDDIKNYIDDVLREIRAKKNSQVDE